MFGLGLLEKIVRLNYLPNIIQIIPDTRPMPGLRAFSDLQSLLK